MAYIVVAVVVACILSVITAYLYIKYNYAKRIFFKILSSFAFVLLAVIVIIHSNSGIYAYGILIALILGFLGDILLSLHPLLNEKDKELFNLSGLVAFLLGHFAYIAVFINISGFKLILLPFILIIPLVVLLMIRMKVINSKKASIPALMYSVIISAMLVTAINVFIYHAVNNSFIILIAAILFVCSDLILTFYNFSKYRLQWMMPLCLIFYYAAEIIFALSIYLITR